jgi:hypothetical protein
LKHACAAPEKVGLGSRAVVGVRLHLYREAVYIFRYRAARRDVPKPPGLFSGSGHAVGRQAF